MKTDAVKLDKRLLAVAHQVREGTTLYDVGSDHAYLPAHLICENKISFAYVCDIADGPLLRAEQTLKNAGVTDKAKLCKANGLMGIDLVYPCDVSVAGMGGELISDIIDAKPELKNKDVRLILQPMTKQDVLRKYLSENGFRTELEMTVFEGKYYTVLVCSYDGIKRELSPIELMFGEKNIRQEDDAFFEAIRVKLAILKAVANGKTAGGFDASYENQIIQQAEKLLEERGI